MSLSQALNQFAQNLGRYQGPDPDDPEYHLLSLEFTPQERGNYFGSTLAFF